MEYRCGHGSFSFSLHFKNKCKLEAETKELALKTNSIPQTVLQKKTQITPVSNRLYPNLVGNLFRLRTRCLTQPRTFCRYLVLQQQEKLEMEKMQN